MPNVVPCLTATSKIGIAILGSIIPSDTRKQNPSIVACAFDRCTLFSCSTSSTYFLDEYRHWTQSLWRLIAYSILCSSSTYLSCSKWWNNRLISSRSTNAKGTLIEHPLAWQIMLPLVSYQLDGHSRLWRDVITANGFWSRYLKLEAKAFISHETSREYARFDLNDCRIERMLLVRMRTLWLPAEWSRWYRALDEEGSTYKPI